jgi:PsbP-like protein
MRKRIVFAALVAWLCTACASTSRSVGGHYDRVNDLYTNETVGFSLAIPERWAIYTDSADFALPLQLQPDQEQVLEAYDPVFQLGLVVVVQDGPLLDIDALVQKMRAMSEERLAKQLTAAHVTNVQQLSVRTTLVNGHEAAEWIYTATDMTGGRPLKMTVSFFILKVNERYVYLTFSVPSHLSATAQPTMTSILKTFTLTSAA